ncbi:hypothetical protein [Pseudorhodoferax sp. Leaf267]|uniref:NUDIX hydrolase n=1 Tax=Pseudorhodoferax sp. Leaf267 TaxID=1736316 RepID=UPI0006F929DB|nr:hypothetical protein [Pseudorhodoferax sp. Leaf267]KQP12845.1 hypothetical protein ASF43_20915 [Pseudorhodoferax sp. Leaf267]
MAAPSDTITAELVAVLVAVTGGQARFLSTHDGHALPSGPLEVDHRSLQTGMRAWIEAQTHHPIGYIEQLYTFADRDRAREDARRVISVSYLGLTREAQVPAPQQAVGWRDWYHHFPWEDQRSPAAAAVLAEHIAPALIAWCAAGAGADASQRRLRVDTAFGLHGAPWNEDFVLQRYELLHEAGLVPEAQRGPAASRGLPAAQRKAVAARTGAPMRLDYRRILATGMARLRAKIKYRPVVFELMPEAFTLLQLQQTIEALAGRALHKQNFRRLVEQQALVEETGQLTQGASGRPAQLFRFREDLLLERAISGSKLPLSR